MIKRFFFSSHLLVLTVAALASVAHARVSVIPSNVNLPAAALITDLSGTPLAGGSFSYGVGIFPPEFDIANAQPATLFACFIRNGSEQNGSSTVPGTLAAFGGATVEDAVTSGAPDFEGKPIDVVIGNAASLAASSEFIVYRAPVNWPQEDDLLGAAAPFTLMDSTLLRGATTTVQNASPLGIAGMLSGTSGVSFPAYVPAYANWAAVSIPNGMDRGFDGDAGGNGLGNGFQYAHHMNPLSGDLRSTPTGSYQVRENGVSSMSFGYDITNRRPDIIHRIERGSDLKGWSEIYRDDPRAGEVWAAPGVNVSAGDVSGRVSILPEDTETGEGRVFWRYNVELIADLAITVENNSDSGAGSLRAAIASAPDKGVIRFAHSVASPITLLSTIDISGKQITIDGTRPTTIGARITVSGGNAIRPFTIGADASVLMRRINVNNGRSPGSGGAILNDGTLQLSQCSFANNATGPDHFGGAIETGGLLQAVDCNFENNTATRGGGAIEVFKARGIAYAQFSRCTFVMNTCTNKNGGGIANFGNVLAINCTFYGNEAQGAAPQGVGGGILNDGILVLRHCTVTGGSASGGVGGGIDSVRGLTLENTLVAGNFTGGNVNGDFITRGVNLLMGDPQLGAFANGVLVPQTGSPVIDAAAVLDTTPIGDAAGESRISGGAPDIGAVEAP